MNEDRLKKYLQGVEKALVGSRKDKKAFLAGFTEDVRHYLDCHPNCTEEEIYTQFGKPEDIGDSFLTNEDAVEFWKKTKMKSLCKRLLIVFVIICAIIITALFAFRVWDIHNLYSGHYEVEVAEGPDSESQNGIAVY